MATSKRGSCPFSNIFGLNTLTIPVSAGNFVNQTCTYESLDNSITAHSGFIDGFLRVVGRGTYILPTGGKYIFRKPSFRGLILHPGVVAIVIRRTVP